MFKFWKKGKRSQDESEQQDPEKKIPKPKKHPKGMYHSRWEHPMRFLRWVFVKSGIISLSFEHFLAMIPATILVPLRINRGFGDDVVIVDMALVLLTSALGTILFTMITKGKIPAYLGSSFAYIALSIYLIKEQMNAGATREMAYTYVCWAYIFSGAVLGLLSFLYMKKGIERILSFLMPATVIGPAISLIGLELADTAVVDSGFDIEDGLVDSKAAIVAIVTLVVIVVFSLFRQRFFKNAAIIVGMAVGCIVSFAINGFPDQYFENVDWFIRPRWQFPLFSPPDLKTLAGLFVAVLPATFIVFTENIGRFTVISRMTRDEAEIEAKFLEGKKEISGEVLEMIPEEKETLAETALINLDENDSCDEVIDDDTGENDIFTENSVKEMRASVGAHGLATLVAGLLGSVPNTIYAENIAVMSIHRRDVKRDEPDPEIKKITFPVSYVPYLIAAAFAILFSCSGYLMKFLQAIPKPVIGGMELFLFGIISAPGIQLLVEQRVDYKKISNQVITAAVLISGISGLSINLGFVDLKGMGLGFVVGVVLNIVVRIIKWIGNLSDIITYEEMACEVLSAFDEYTLYRILGYQKENQKEVDYTCNYSIKGFAYALKGKDCRVRMPGNAEEHISDDMIRDEIKHTVLLEVGYGRNGTKEDAVLRLKRTVNGLFLDIKTAVVPENVKKAYLNDYDAIDEDGDWLVIKVTEMPMRCICALIKRIDRKSFYGTVDEVLSVLKKNSVYQIKGYQREGQEKEYRTCRFHAKALSVALKDKKKELELADGEKVSPKAVRIEINQSSLLEVERRDTAEVVMRFKKLDGDRLFFIKAEELSEKIKRAYLRDYDVTDEGDGWLAVRLSDIPLFRVHSVLRRMDRRKR